MLFQTEPHCGFDFGMGLHFAESWVWHAPLRSSIRTWAAFRFRLRIVCCVVCVWLKTALACDVAMYYSNRGYISVPTFARYLWNLHFAESRLRRAARRSIMSTMATLSLTVAQILWVVFFADSRLLRATLLRIISTGVALRLRLRCCRRAA